MQVVLVAASRDKIAFSIFFASSSAVRSIGSNPLGYGVTLLGAGMAGVGWRLRVCGRERGRAATNSMSPISAGGDGGQRLS